MPAVTGVWGPNVWGDDVWGADVWAGDSPEPADPPVVTSITPNDGTVDGGTECTIAGTGFHADAEVDFGGTPATSVVFESSTELTVVTPAHAAGAVTVTVTNPDAQDDTTTFTYEEAAEDGGAVLKKIRIAAVIRARR